MKGFRQWFESGKARVPDVSHPGYKERHVSKANSDVELPVRQLAAA